MIDVARHDHPHLRFEVGSMTDLDLPDGSVAGLLAFWSLIHVPDEAVPTVFGHFRRVLRPGGPLLLGFHVGDESRLKTEGYGGHPMNVHVHRRRPEQVAAWLRDAGFTVEAHMLTDPDGSVPGAILFARGQSWPRRQSRPRLAGPDHVSSPDGRRSPRGTVPCRRPG